jgi:hypothetical protein
MRCGCPLQATGDDFFFGDVRVVRFIIAKLNLALRIRLHGLFYQRGGNTYVCRIFFLAKETWRVSSVGLATAHSPLAEPRTVVVGPNRHFKQWLEATFETFLSDIYF